MARRGAPMASVALLCAALLAACSGDEAHARSPDADTPQPQPQPQPLLALGTVLHAPLAPAEARALEVDALVYLRCYATSTKAPIGFDHPDSMLLDAAGNAAGSAASGGGLGITPAMVVAAASASRDSGLHATLPVETVTSHADAAGGAHPAAGGNAYTVGDWAALGTADLWCELYDIDRAMAGMADAIGGALLRAADFAAAGTDQLSLPFVSVVGGTAQRAATVTFRCPLCVFGDASPSSLAAAWAEGASPLAAPALPRATSFTSAAQAALTDALAHAGGAAYAHASAAAFASLAAQAGATDALPAELAELISAMTRAAAASAHANGISRDVPHVDGAAADWLGAMLVAATDHAASALGAVAAASATPAPANDALGIMEAEAIAAVREAAAAARRRNSDVAIFVYAVAGLATRLASDADVPIALTRVKVEPPPHVRAAVAAARDERWGDATSSATRTAAVVAATLAAVALAAGATVAWRRRAVATGPQAAAAAHRKLKRKNSDFHTHVAAAAGTCEVPLGTPRDATPRGSATPRSARREAGANAA